MRSRAEILVAGLALLLGVPMAALAAEYYVDVESRGGPASDVGSGSLEQPWRTLARAAVDLKPRPGPGDTVWVSGARDRRGNG